MPDLIVYPYRRSAGIHLLFITLVLGRSGIFDRFKICFDERRFVVTLAPLD